MAAAGLPAAAAAAIAGGKEAQGIIKQVTDTLNHDILTFHWERERDRWGRPRMDRKMVLTAVDFKITNGLVLGVALVAVAWEVGNWFAQALQKVTGAFIPNISDLTNPNSSSAEWVLATGAIGTSILQEQGLPGIIQNLLPRFIPAPQGANTTPGPGQTLISLPPTFGAALNRVLRDLTIAGPGTLSNLAVRLASKLQVPGEK